MKFIDCQGFAGAFALGASQSGFELLHKVEGPGGFGIPAFTANTHIFGTDFGYEAGPPAEWHPFPAELLVSNPPCSGFSGLNTVRNTKNARGKDSAINQCMHDTFAYAAKVQPEIVIMESVRAAYTLGKPLMRELVDTLRERTGRDYRITHVMQNNLSCGGVANRPRYFLVASVIPFGVEIPVIDRVPVLRDAIDDLTETEMKWDPQVLGDEGTWWSKAMHTPSHQVDGCMPDISAHYRRLMDLVKGRQSVEWLPGEIDLQVLEKYWTEYATLPESWDYQSSPRDMPRAPRSEVLIKRQFKPAGFSSVLGWLPDQPSRVLTGAGPSQWFNTMANRMPTHRECARIMGFPDWWRIQPMSEISQLGAFWGKQTSVHPARWITFWAWQSIMGSPGSVLGDHWDDGYADRVIDISAEWKPVWKKQTGEANNGV